MEGFVNINGAPNMHNHCVRRGFKNIRPVENILTYMFQGKPITYNNRTMNYYKMSRKCHVDPILDTEVDENIAFKFSKQWDPYTGQTMTDDPFGSLYFNPISLIYNFYAKRLDGLWKDETRDVDGYYDGYYDRFVGAGSEMEIVGRDKYPELYLFRIPILDCYLTPDHKSSIVTVGPLLSDDDISKLEELSHDNVVQTMYQNSFGQKCPSIVRMKRLYDNAISKNPDLPTCNNKYIVPQHFYVDELRKL